MATQSAERWLALGKAAQLVGVNEATLRHWANQGLLRAFRTPGGHRRLLRDDLLALTRDRARRPGAGEWSEHALEGMRRRLHNRRKGPPGPVHSFDENAKARMRVMGRRLVLLANEYVDRKRPRSELQEEARYLGQEYGRELLSLSMKLSEAIGAFQYFRNVLHQTISQAAAPSTSIAARERASNGAMEVEDIVLRGLAEAYEQGQAAQVAARARSSA